MGRGRTTSPTDSVVAFRDCTGKIEDSRLRVRVIAIVQECGVKHDFCFECPLEVDCKKLFDKYLVSPVFFSAHLNRKARFYIDPLLRRRGELDAEMPYLVATV